MWRATIPYSGTVTSLRVGPAGVRLPAGARYYCLLQNYQKGFDASRVSWKWVPGFFPRGVAAGGDFNTHHLSVPRLRMSGTMLPLPPP
jgi:hypothetical protein